MNKCMNVCCLEIALTAKYFLFFACVLVHFKDNATINVNIKKLVLIKNIMLLNFEHSILYLMTASYTNF